MMQVSQEINRAVLRELGKRPGVLPENSTIDSCENSSSLASTKMRGVTLLQAVIC